jgi:MFS transporter, YNFM family, putative membrane transport protein
VTAIVARIAGGFVGTAILGETFDRIGWPACAGGIALALGAAALLAFRLQPPSGRRQSDSDN